MERSSQSRSLFKVPKFSFSIALVAVGIAIPANLVRANEVQNDGFESQPLAAGAYIYPRGTLGDWVFVTGPVCSELL